MTEEVQSAVLRPRKAKESRIPPSGRSVPISVFFIIISIYPILLLVSAFLPVLQDFLADRTDVAFVGAFITLLATGLLGLRYWRLTEDVKRTAGRVSALDIASGEPEIGLPPERELVPLIVAMNQQLSKLAEVQRSSHVFNASNRVLARQVQRFGSLLNSIGDGVLMLDNSGNVAYANDEMGRFLSRCGSEVAGQHYSTCIKDRVLVQLIREGTNGENLPGVQIGEFESGDEDIKRSFQVQSSYGFVNESIPLGRILLVREVTERAAAEALQRDFVDSIAHELRTPLTSILGCVELLIDEEASDPDSKRKFYNIIYSESYRLSNLIDTILNMSMIESGAAKLDVHPIRLMKFLEDGLDVIRLQCEVKGVELVSELPDRLPTVDVDKDFFKVVVMNLLSNAAKYTSEGESIFISFESDPNEIVISIRDTGIGIAEADLPHIFEKFYRCNAEGSADISGSGVGLATSMQIMRLHGGDLRVESALNVGTTFEIVLPRSVVNSTIGE